MFEHVLVPLDQSPLSEKALPYALHIVPPDGTLTLLIAVDDLQQQDVLFTPYIGAVIAFPEVEEKQEEFCNQAKSYLKRVTSELRKPLPTIKHSVHIGLPADGIVDYAIKSNVNAIVMCTHGRTGLGRWAMGSVTQKVLSAAPCPVIVIPGGKLQQ